MVTRSALIMMLALCTASAQADIPPLYQRVAQKHGIPAKVLYALALGESKTPLTSGQVRPWPWTINFRRESYFYNTYDEACKALHRFMSISHIVDIGLTQHNWHWQKKHFSSPCAAFDPLTNLNHAAKLLLEGKRIHGNWVNAAGYFHRPAGGPKARRYEATFATHLKQLSHL